MTEPQTEFSMKYYRQLSVRVNNWSVCRSFRARLAQFLPMQIKPWPYLKPIVQDEW